MHTAYVMNLSMCDFLYLAFYKRNKKLHPHALLRNISTWEFLRTLKKCKKHPAAPRASLCSSLVFLKIPVCLYNSTMALDAYFFRDYGCKTGTKENANQTS